MFLRLAPQVTLELFDLNTKCQPCFYFFKSDTDCTIYRSRNTSWQNYYNSVTKLLLLTLRFDWVKLITWGYTPQRNLIVTSRQFREISDVSIWIFQQMNIYMTPVYHFFSWNASPHEKYKTRLQGYGNAGFHPVLVNKVFLWQAHK